jgi:hypothetical protein
LKAFTLSTRTWIEWGKVLTAQTSTISGSQELFLNLSSLFKVVFYLPHMEYEGSIGLVTGKMIFFVADFHVLVLFNFFMIKKHDLSDNFFSLPMPLQLPFA